MNVKDLLITLVRQAIKGEKANREEIEKSLSGEKLSTLFKVSKKHDVAHLVADSIEKLGLSLEGEAWQAFLKEKEQSCLRYEMIQADINEISACFNSQGIDFIPLKGAVIRSIYPEPWMRTSCDIDILVREDDLDRAVAALVLNCSYKTDNKKTYHDISLFSPFGMHLELHYNIKENQPQYDKLLTQVWDFSKKVADHMYSESEEFLIYHLIAHMAYHFAMGGCGFRSVLDLWLVKNKLDFDTDSLKTMLKNSGLERFYTVISELADHWFGENISLDSVVLDAEKYILLGGAYGTQKQGAVSTQIKMGGKVKYFRSRIFMDYNSLSLLYPIIKKHKILTPFCQITRWFGAIFKSKRIVNEIKNVSSTSSEDINNIKRLLNDLGL